MIHLEFESCDIFLRPLFLYSGFCNVEELIIVHKPFGVFLSDILHDVGKGETCLAC